MDPVYKTHEYTVQLLIELKIARNGSNAFKHIKFKSVI